MGSELTELYLELRKIWEKQHFMYNNHVETLNGLWRPEIASASSDLVLCHLEMPGCIFELLSINKASLSCLDNLRPLPFGLW